MNGEVLLITEVCNGCLSELAITISADLFFADVTIGFSQNVYSVEEDDDNGNGNVVEVCVEVFGELDRDVAVTLTTTGQTAIGICNFVVVFQIHT